MCLNNGWEIHYTRRMLNTSTEKGQKAKRENHCTFVQTHYNTDPSDFKVIVIELVTSQAKTSLPVGLPGKLLFWEGPHLIMHACDTCQAGLLPQLIFFHNLPCMLNLIILAHGQTGGAYSIRDPGHKGDLFAEKAGFWQKTQHLGVMKPALLGEHGQNRLH